MVLCSPQNTQSHGREEKQRCALCTKEEKTGSKCAPPPSNTTNICTGHRKVVGIGLPRISLWLQQWLRAAASYGGSYQLPPFLSCAGKQKCPSICVRGEWKLRLRRAVWLAESVLSLAQVPWFSGRDLLARSSALSSVYEVALSVWVWKCYLLSPWKSGGREPE